MQIQIFRDGDSVVAIIPTTGGDRRAELPLDTVQGATVEKPAIFLLADPDPSAGYVKPFGERPVYEQDQIARQHREHSQNLIQADADEQGIRFLEPPNSTPESKTQQSSIRGFASTAQHGMTAREIKGVPHVEEQERLASEQDIGEVAGAPGETVEIHEGRPAASLPDRTGAEPYVGARTAPGVSQGSQTQVTQHTSDQEADASGGAYDTLDMGELKQAQNTLDRDSVKTNSERTIVRRSAPPAAESQGATAAQAQRNNVDFPGDKKADGGTSSAPATRESDRGSDASQFNTKFS